MSPFVLLILTGFGATTTMTVVEMPSREVCERARGEITALMAGMFNSRVAICLDRGEARR